MAAVSDMTRHESSGDAIGSSAAAPAKSLRVLHLCAGNLFGGIETYLLTLARSGSFEPRLKSEFAVCFPGRFEDELRAAGVPVHKLGPVRLSRPWTVLRARRRLNALLASARPDRVVVHGSWSQFVFGSVVNRRHIPLVLQVHGPLSETSLLDRWARRVPVDLILTNSDHMLAGLASFYGDVPRFVYRYPVAADSLGGRSRDAIRAELGTPPETVVIIQVSRLERWKGQQVLLEALARLSDVANWECWIVGGPQRPEEELYLQELRAFAAAECDGRRVKFLGQRSDVAELLRAADVFCQPNTGPEPFGIVFIEALYRGLCVATSNLGGGAEIVTPECGRLTPPGDAAALAATLAEWIANPSRRRTASISGPARAAQLCDPRRQIRTLYETLSAANVRSS